MNDIVPMEIEIPSKRLKLVDYIATRDYFYECLTQNVIPQLKIDKSYNEETLVNHKNAQILYLFTVGCWHLGITINGKHLEKLQLRNFTKAFQEKEKIWENNPTSYQLYPLFDQFESRGGLGTFFYDVSGSFRKNYLDWMRINDLLLKRVFHRKTSSRMKAYSSVNSTFEIVLQETISNTEEHGRKSINGGTIDYSTRVIFLDEQEGKEVDKLLGSRIKLTQTNSEWISKKKWLVIDICDFGPGFVATKTKNKRKNLSESENKSTIMECFEKGMSKIVSSHSTHKGNGLHSISKALKDTGIILIQTSGFSLVLDYTNFTKQRSDADNLIPLGFKKLDSLDKGTKITVLISVA